MSKNEQEFARLVSGLDVNAEPNPEHRELLRQQVLSEFNNASPENTTLRSTWPSHQGIGIAGNTVVSYWRTFMASRLTRYGAVAAVATLIILGLTFIDGKNKKTGKAWAIEQTIQALQNVRSVYLRGTINAAHSTNTPISEGKVVWIPFELWARTNDASRGQDACFDTSTSGQIMVKHDNIVYRYHPGPDIVYIQDGNTFTAVDLGGDQPASQGASAQAGVGQHENGERGVGGDPQQNLLQRHVNAVSVPLPHGHQDDAVSGQSPEPDQKLRV